MWWAGAGSNSDPASSSVAPSVNTTLVNTTPVNTTPDTTAPPTTAASPTTSVVPVTTAPPTTLPALSAGPVVLATPGGSSAIMSIDGTLRFRAGDTVAVTVQADQVPIVWTFGHLADCSSVAGSANGVDVSGATGDGPAVVPSFTVVASPLADDATSLGRYVVGSVQPTHQMARLFVTAEACAAGVPVQGGTQVQGFARLAPVVVEVVLPADLPVGRVMITIGDETGEAVSGLVVEVTAG